MFNGVVSFKDREAAATFLALVGSVVDDSVQVFHAKTEPGGPPRVLTQPCSRFEARQVVGRTGQHQDAAAPL